MNMYFHFKSQKTQKNNFYKKFKWIEIYKKKWSNIKNCFKKKKKIEINKSSITNIFF